MELWAAISVAAAFLQNLRSALQKALTGRVDVLGATYARFLFAAPLAVLLAAAVIRAAGPPGLGADFVGWALLGGAGQIAAQVLLLRLFRLRNFAVGNAFARTETVQAAILGAVLLGDWLAPLPALGILVSVAGVLLLSTGAGLPGGGALNAAAGLGVASGTAFALSGVSYRAAALSLDWEAGFFARAAVTLAFVTVAQTLAMTLWMRWRAPGAVTAVLRAWRVAAPAGVAGMLASLGWFSAFALAPAAEVKAVGQVELLFSAITARFAFGERASPREIAGMALVAGGIVLLVLTR